MCDRIREEDDRIKSMRGKPCMEVNSILEICLSENDRDFRKCKLELLELKKCMEVKKNKSNDLNITNNK
jgi:hypothetical protein